MKEDNKLWIYYIFFKILDFLVIILRLNGEKKDNNKVKDPI